LGFIYYFKKLKYEYVINQVEHINLPYFTPSPIVRRKIIFSGSVQNVGLRLEICELAKRLNLTGWVKNRPDKNVEAEIQGENEKITFLINYMKSLKRASVNGVVINERSIVDFETDFIVIKE
jgi:acylphosphatase